jgi:hypothetical protein
MGVTRFLKAFKIRYRLPTYQRTLMSEHSLTTWQNSWHDPKTPNPLEPQAKNAVTESLPKGTPNISVAPSPMGPLVGKWRGDSESHQSPSNESYQAPEARALARGQSPIGRKPANPTPSEELGRKETNGKVRLSLLWREPLGLALEGVAKILEYGIKKYKVQAGNWAKVEGAEEKYSDALYRHLAKAMAGEFIDPESGEPHMAHAACNCLFVLAIQLRDRQEHTEHLRIELETHAP